jgi:hypothetical protein
MPLQKKEKRGKQRKNWVIRKVVRKFVSPKNVGDVSFVFLFMCFGFVCVA